MLGLFSFAIFLSAALLFAVQPMVGKMILPKLGGSPSVWNTCMVFFQALLLLGYTYAHLLSTRVSVKGQFVLHAIALLAAGVALPIALPAVLPNQFDWAAIPGGETLAVVGWLILVLTLTAGAPFLVLSATAPLLQSWFAKTNHPQAKDPYFLYAASNAGSILGLVAYPLLIEPNLGLSFQGKAWGFAYGLLAFVLVAAAVVAAGRLTQPTPASELPDAFRPPETESPAEPSRRDRLRWLLLAAAPSSVSLGVTQYISTDIAAVPLLWAIPLLIYLLSFIFAFSKRGVNVTLWSRILVVACCLIAFPLLSGAKSPTMLIVAGHLFVLLAASMACHGRLAKERPSAKHLTEYYLIMSLGGMIGGIANAIIAPIVLPVVLEYQFALVAAVLLRPKPERTVHTVFYDMFAVAAFVILVAGSMYASSAVRSPNIGVTLAIMPGIPCAACLLLLIGGGRLRFAAGLLILLTSGAVRTLFGDEHVIYTERTFFGVYKVFTHKDHSFHTLYHGTTNHGVEARYLLPNIRPATYYHPTGPIGQILTEDSFGDKFKSIGAIGLGTGSLALYNEPGCTMRFFEIDPAIVRIATSPEYFDYLDKKYTRGTLEIALGDGRLEIAKVPDHSYGIIVLDAFSSDAIPTHLLTREALAIYRAKLQPGGLICIHISNIFFDLKPVVAALANDSNMVALFRHDKATKEQFNKEAKSDSMWVAMAADPKDLGPLMRDDRWESLKYKPGDPLWTDDYSNVLKVLNWW